jgi:hypothetical protein
MREKWNVRKKGYLKIHIAVKDQENSFDKGHGRACP